MQFLTLISSLLSVIVICTALLFLKLIRMKVLNCIAIKRIKWGHIRVKFLDCKIAVEIISLNIQLYLLSEEEHQRTFFTTTKKHSSQEKEHSSYIVKSYFLSFPAVNQGCQFLNLVLLVFLGILKAFVSYLFSWITIVLRESVFEFETSGRECIQVCLICILFFFFYCLLFIVFHCMSLLAISEW